MSSDTLGQTIVVSDVLAERDRQDEKWGVQDRPLPVYFCILAEEVGETAETINALTLAGPSASRLDAVRKELVQVAAVAVAMVESIDRARDCYLKPSAAPLGFIQRFKSRLAGGGW